VLFRFLARSDLLALDLDGTSRRRRESYTTRLACWRQLVCSTSWSRQASMDSVLLGIVYIYLPLQPCLSMVERHDPFGNTVVPIDRCLLVVVPQRIQQQQEGER